MFRVFLLREKVNIVFFTKRLQIIHANLLLTSIKFDDVEELVYYKPIIEIGFIS